MNKIIYLFLLIFLSLCVLDSEGRVRRDDLSKSILGEFENEPSDSLLKRGEALLASQKTDSALIVLRTLVGRAELAPYDDNSQSSAIAKGMARLGFVYAYNYKDYYNGWKLINKSISLAKEQNLDSALAYAYRYYGGFFGILHDLSKNEALADSSLNYYQLALDMFISAKDSTMVNITSNYVLTLAYNYGKLGSIENTVDNLKNSASSIPGFNINAILNRYDIVKSIEKGQFDKADAMMDSLESTGVPAYDFFPLRVENLMKRGEPLKAAKLCEEYLQFIDKTNDPHVKLLIYELLHKLYAKGGNESESQRWEVEYYRLHDELTSHTDNDIIGHIQAIDNYETASASLSEITKNFKRQRITIIVASIILTVLLIMLYIILRLYTKLRNEHKSLYERSLQIIEQTPLEKPNEENPDDKEELISEEEDIPAESLKLRDKILEVMENPELICNEDFSIKKLAEIVEASQKDVSKTINIYCRCNFHTLLSDFRIKEACRRINNEPDFRMLTTEAIANEIGFKSRSHFTALFKSIIGISPSDYIREAKRTERQQ